MSNAMSEEIRRSGRANKGHHSKNADALDEPVVKAKQKSKQEKKAPAEPEVTRSASVQTAEQYGDDIYRCVCGDQREIRGREMIMCDRCEAWQHNKCLNLPGSDYWEDKTYLCEVCAPDQHKDLLAAMARGEKPWARKKSSKSSRPSYRPSDVASEAATPKATPEKQDVPMSQPAQTPTPAPASTVSPAAASAPEEVPPEPTNGQIETKSKKKATPKSQPQSPSAEKRSHDAIADKDVKSAKRRKSSAPHHEKVVPQSTVATDALTLPDKQRLMVEQLVKTFTPLIKEASKSRGYRVPDGATPTSIATRLALQIDHAAAIHHGPPDGNTSPYVLRIKSIMFNTKTNTVLVDRLLDGSLPPEEIVTMAAEEMASEEKQKEFAAIREANEKQMVLTEEPGPRLRKTHKGEEMVGVDNMDAVQEFRPPERRVDESKPAEQKSPPQDDGGPVVELPESITESAPLSIDTSTPKLQSDSIRRPSTTFDINNIFNQVQSPQQDQQAFLHRRQSSIRAQQTPKEGPVVDDADIDRLLKDEDNDVEMTGYTADPTVVWRGTLDMQTLGPFDAVARFVAGGDFGQVIPWDKLLSPALPIQGRIESQRGNAYIEGLSHTCVHDVGVLSVSPVTPEGQAICDQLFNYFHPRDRWGVVPVEKLDNPYTKDLYVIPIEPGGSELPRFLNMLEYCTIETPRQERMILLALVAKLPEPEPQFPANPYPVADMAAGQVGQPMPPVNGPTNGPSPSPVNPHGPQYSPVQPNFPPGVNTSGPFPPSGPNGPVSNNIPLHLRNPRAVQIFGPHIEDPVVVQILSHSPDMPEPLMQNLRHIVETVPAARTDFGIFQQHMAQHTQGAAEAQAQPPTQQ